MTYDDIVILFNKAREEKDKYGNTHLIFDEISISQAFCHVRDIGREEFYLGKNNRYKPSKVITMKANQYEGAQYMIIGKSMDLKKDLNDFVNDENIKLFKLIRTYSPSSLMLGRNEKKIIGAYKPGRDDVEIVLEEQYGTPRSEIREQVKKILGSDEN